MKINLKVNSFAIEIWAEEAKCTFYTVRKIEENLSETDKFFIKYRAKEHLKRSLLELVNFMVRYIGQKTGALSYFFRFENKAQALPPPSKFSQLSINTKGFPLRLYCLRISNEIVILFNGAEKDSQKAQEGSTKKAFNQANYFAQKIDNAIINKELILNLEERKLSSFEGKNTIIIE